MNAAGRAATQKELDEFMLDLIELLGKHFQGWFDRTRVAGGNDGMGIRFTRAATASELELSTDGRDPRFGFAGAAWSLGGGSDREGLFTRVQGELSAIFQGRLAVVTGYREGVPAGSLVLRDRDDAQAEAAFRERYPDCDRLTLKRWNRPEAILPLGAISP